jgi:hypothetical protein
MPTRAEEYLQKNSEIPALEVTLPSGIVFMLRRPALQQWAMAGCLPPYFAEDVRKAWKASQALDAEAATPEQRRAWVLAFREMVKWACVSPRLVEDGNPENDELDPTYLSQEDQQFIWNFVSAGSPGIPIQLEQPNVERGQMQIDVNDLQQFRPF